MSKRHLWMIFIYIQSRLGLKYSFIFLYNSIECWISVSRAILQKINRMDLLSLGKNSNKRIKLENEMEIFRQGLEEKKILKLPSRHLYGRCNWRVAQNAGDGFIIAIPLSWLHDDAEWSVCSVLSIAHTSQHSSTGTTGKEKHRDTHGHRQLCYEEDKYLGWPRLVKGMERILQTMFCMLSLFFC